MRDLMGPTRRIVPLLLFLAVGRLSCQTVRPQSSLTAADIANLRQYLQEQMQAAGIPAIAVAVVQGRKIVWEEGFGLADLENRIPASPRTPFYLASVTKAFTGTAVMILQDQRKLDLNRPVNDYLGAARIHSPMWNVDEATVRRVATHTAGLTTYNRKCAVQDTQCEVSTDTAIRHYGVLFWPPGDHFDYSNLGYGILGEVVSKVSGQNFGNFLQSKVFQPLGMRDCFMGTEGAGADQIAAQYDSSSHISTPVKVSDTPAASSAHCSVHDLALFGMCALGESVATQKRILSDASLQIMLNPTVDEGDGERYGFGWSLQPDDHGYLTINAQGGTNDAFAMLELVPSEKIAVAITANTGTLVPFKIVNTILSDLLPRYRGAMASEKPNSRPKDASAVSSSSLVGSWAGSLQTWKSSVPLAIEISPSLQVQAKWAEDQPMAATHVRITDPRFHCVIRGQIGTPDAPQAPTDIELELYLHGGELVGAGTTGGNAQLPYWVLLKKASASPGDH